MIGLEALRALARGKVHAGYRWAAVAGDGELICESCVRENYRLMFRATRDGNRQSDWRCIGIMNSGEHDSEADQLCVNCDRVLFEGVQS